MFICGIHSVGGALACALTPTNIKNINYVELKNGIYDDLYITKAADFETPVPKNGILTRSSGQSSTAVQTPEMWTGIWKIPLILS